MKKPLGFLGYMKITHPVAYAMISKEYTNYSNWLSSNFIKVGHIYQRSKTGRFYIINGMKGVLVAVNSRPYIGNIFHIDRYDPYKKEIIKGADDFITDSWMDSDRLYNLMLEDVTSNFEVVPVDTVVKCPYSYHIISEKEDEISILFTDISYKRVRSKRVKDNCRDGYRRDCTCLYTIYKLINVDGIWICFVNNKNQIKLAANNSDGWCVDTDLDKYGKGHYEGRWSSIREVKKKFMGIDSYRKCPSLIEYIQEKNINIPEYKFVPYPIKTF